VGCSPSKETTQSSKKSKPSSNELTKLSEKEQIDFNFIFHNANKERILGNYEIAANLFLKCIQIAPKEPTPYYELAHIFEDSKETKLALEYAEKAVTLAPDNYWFRLLYAHALQRDGNSVDAIKQYEILIEKNGGNIDLYFDIAGMQLYSGKYKDALENFNLIEKQMGITEEISVQKEKIFIKLGDVDKAANEIQLLIEAFPDELKYQVLLADLYIANELTEKAFEVFKTILEKDPQNPYAHLSLYDYYKNENENEKATESIKKAFASTELDIDTKVKILISYYSATEQESELIKEAFELNKILIKTHPNEAKAYTIYADFLYREKKLEGARDNYLKAIEFDNSKFAIWSQLIFIESELMDNDSILKHSKTAIELFPNQPLFYFFYGSINLQKQNFEEAIEYLTIGKDYIIDNAPLLAQFYANLGDAYNGSKKYEESDKAYEEALKIEPKNIYVLNNYGYYLSLREEKLDRAEELSALCNELEPDQSNYQDTYAWILYKQGKFVQAKEWLEKALENGGKNNAVILEHLGDVYSKLNNIVKALEYWNKAKEIGKGDTTEFLERKIADKKLYE
jgi:tetratricopeptide (TPR) repeat protein